MEKRIMLIKKHGVYIAAFLFPCIIVFLHLITRNSWIFGDGSILRGDAGIQYVYIFEELWNKVHSGDLSFYSWNAMSGYDFYLNVIYYAISPATLILLILPKSMLYDGIQFFMVLKWALLSLSSVYFFMHTKFNTLKKNRKLVAFTLGVCYALGNFFIDMLCLFNWLDSLILFPVLLLLIENMTESGKWKLYYCVLTVCIFCNFYISFPICIFVTFWFLVNLWKVHQEDMGKRIKTFLGSSILAGISSMVIIIPSIFNVNSRYTEGSQNVQEYVRSIIKTVEGFVKKFFIFSSVDENHLSTCMFMSIGAIVLGLLFFFIKSDKRIKYTKIAMFLLVLASFFIGALNYFWHGFSVPHGIDSRYAFGFILLFCIMGLEVFANLKQIKLQHCFIVFAVSLALFFYTFFHLTHFEAVYVYLGTLFLIVLYNILFMLNRRKSISNKIFIRIFCCLCILEISANAYYQLRAYEVLRPEKIGNVAEAEKQVEGLKVKEGQRVAFQDAGYGMGMKTGLPSISGFVSFFNGNLGDLCYNLGMNRVSDAAIDYSGGTPVMNVMFNIGYGVGGYESEFSDCEVVKSDENMILCKMNRPAGLGYMVSDDIVNWEGNDLSNFVNQNEFVEKATNGAVKEVFKVFTPDVTNCACDNYSLDTVTEELEEAGVSYHYLILDDEENSVLEFEADEDMDLYFTIKGSTEYYSSVMVNNQLVYKDVIKMGRNIVHLKDIKAGDKVSINNYVEGEAGEEAAFYMQFARFDFAQYDTFYDMISKNIYDITSMKPDDIKGTISVDKAGVMMTSIQNMKGFQVFVNGKKANYITIGQALIGVPLEPGEYEIEFQYRTPNFVTGCVLSGAGIMIFIFMCIWDRKKRRDKVDSV